MTPKGPRERAPEGDALTDYDREHAALYLRLLDAEAAGADWRDVSKTVFGGDLGEHAESQYRSHLARAHWLRDGAYGELFGEFKS